MPIPCENDHAVELAPQFRRDNVVGCGQAIAEKPNDHNALVIDSTAGRNDHRLLSSCCGCPSKKLAVNRQQELPHIGWSARH
jgi:hypothetical protein